MPVPTSITDLSTNPTANSPQGSESAKGTVDDYFRAHASFLALLRDLVSGFTVTLPSAATVAIGAASSLNVAITGTSNITAFDSVNEGVMRWVLFYGAMTVTHNAAKMQLPGSANISTTSGDVGLFKSLGGGNWKCLSYQRTSGAGAVPMLPLAGGTMTGGLTLNNFVSLLLKDTGGTARPTLYMDDGNTVNLLVAGAGLLRILSQDASNELWRIDNGGNVTLSGAHKVKAVGNNGTTRIAHHVAQSDGAIRFQLALDSDESPSLFTYTTAGAYSGSVKFNNGGVAASGAISGVTVTQTSDERKKRNWQRLPGDFIAKLAGIRKSGLFQWKKGGQGLGVGAQSLEQILPQAVHTDDTGAKTVNYGAASMVAVVELAREVVDLRARIAKLEPR